MERAQSIALGRRLKLKWVLDASKLTCVNNNFVIGINTNVTKISYRGGRFVQDFWHSYHRIEFNGSRKFEKNSDNLGSSLKSTAQKTYSGWSEKVDGSIPRDKSRRFKEMKLDGLKKCKWTVKREKGSLSIFKILGPSTFSQKTVHFDRWPSSSTHDSPLWKKTVHFWMGRSLSRDRSLKGPSILPPWDRPL